jgi:hypothetical protein
MRRRPCSSTWSFKTMTVLRSWVLWTITHHVNGGTVLPVQSAEKGELLSEDLGATINGALPL